MSTLTLSRLALATGLLLGLAASTRAEETVLSRVLEACGTEADRLCSQITPGNGRVIACLYAHEDQLSRRCDYVLFDAAAELESMMGAMRRVGVACKPDIELLCAGNTPGEGRILQCLRREQMALSAPCHDAIEAEGIHVN